MRDFIEENNEEIKNLKNLMKKLRI